MARPRKQVDSAAIDALRREGLSFPEIARRMHVSIGTVHQAHRSASDVPFKNPSSTPVDVDPASGPDAPVVLGSFYVRVENTADKLQLNSDGSFLLQESGRAYHGPFFTATEY